ncbi:MAG: ribonuclease H-like domain-containing protein [candidate division Zixibacteria bacterium]|nr:ribonuclease H-like domain-containing protein [candidate division Zixibacteria bacterium]
MNPTTARKLTSADLAGILEGEVLDGALFFERFLSFEQAFFPQNPPDEIDAGKNIAGELFYLCESKNFRWRDLLVIDTETTGLSGGSGNFAFLLGVAEVQADGLKFTQIFLPDFVCEPVLLSYLSEKLKSRNLLGSYNGRAFDWPLLETRFLLNKQRPIVPEEHLDFLFIARRLFKNSISPLSLSNLEAELLKRPRVGDIPGELIPQTYFDFLITGNPYPLKKVLAHNLKDLAATAALGLFFSHWAEKPEKAAGLESPLGRFLLKAGSVEKARPVLERKSKEIRTEEDARAAFELSLSYKKEQNWEAACRLWQKLAEESTFPVQRLLCLRELAMFYEHRKKEYPTAFACAQQAAKSSPISNSWLQADFARRRERLEGKLSRDSLHFGRDK